MIFLDDAEVVKLTGRKTKSKQVEQLKAMAIPFYLNAAHRPIVAVAVVEGGTKAAAAVPKPWKSKAHGA